MGEVITVGLDIAKHVFQVHGIDDQGSVVIRRKVRRSDLLKFFRSLQPCLVGIEACATAHHWGRELQAMGHQVRLMPPAYVKPYVKRQKNDMADAEAICEAVSRPTMRFVPVKTREQQAVLMLHRSRELLIRQRTMLINALRGHLAEFGVVMRQGAAGVTSLIAMLEDRGNGLIDPTAREALSPLVAQLHDTQGRIAGLDRRILNWHRSNAVSRRLDNPRHWANHRKRHCCYDHRSFAVPIRTPACCLARAGASAKLQRRERPPGPHHQERRRIYSPSLGDRGSLGPALRAQRQECFEPVGSRARIAKALQGGRNRLGQQNGEDRLGGVDPRGGV